MTWSDEANEIVAELIGALPAPVRDAVKDNMENRAESLQEPPLIRNCLTICSAEESQRRWHAIS